MYNPIEITSYEKKNGHPPLRKNRATECPDQSQRPSQFLLAPACGKPNSKRLGGGLTINWVMTVQTLIFFGTWLVNVNKWVLTCFNCSNPFPCTIHLRMTSVFAGQIQTCLSP